MAATAVQIEIESFVGKFLYLSSCGYTADLSFSTSNGDVRVNFQASLRSSSPPSRDFYPRRQKPSKARRRQRRKESSVNHTSSAIFSSLGALGPGPRGGPLKLGTELKPLWSLLI